MKVCYWGTYDRNYPRNRILISGLRRNGVEVVECHAAIWRDTAEKMAAASSSWANFRVLYRWLRGYLGLVRRFMKIKDIDFIIIGYSGHFDVFIAKVLSKVRRIPLVFDAFLSLYDSLVLDRKVVSKSSFRAKLLHYIDKYSCKLSDLVLLDTNEHINYFVSEFGIPKERFRRIFIGADDTIFFPMKREKRNNAFTVTHFGKYIPLHGMRYIIKAAKELETHDINFQLIGSGDEYESSVKLAKNLGLENVEFIEFLEQKELTRYIQNADVCLGIFGDTDKARRVVPNKAYEAMAMKKPLMSGDSAAAREILKDGENCILCRMEDPYAIAETVLKLKRNEELRRKIADGAYTTYGCYCSPSALGRQLKGILLQRGGLPSGRGVGGTE